MVKRACLAICLACAVATPFPFENLKEGMTDETVRERFGEPEAIEIKLGSAESIWTYVHEEQHWPMTALFSTVFLLPCALGALLFLPLAGEVMCTPIDEKRVLLHFEAEKLARWEVDPREYRRPSM